MSQQTSLPEKAATGSSRLTTQLATHWRQVHNGGNWTGVNLKDTLQDISLEEATRKTGDLNTIAVLVFHINYYVGAVLQVLKGGPLEASDKYSFNLPPIENEEAWQELLRKTFTEAEALAAALETLNGEELFQPFADGKYGNGYRNVLGLIEHTHYHLGQISLLKKFIRTGA
jgi:uncharacterized damage-inducible protein DinB